MARTRLLTPALIAWAALEAGDRDGHEAMTMRRIASDLGCDPMALYRHFANREALLDAVADLALAEVPNPDLEDRWDKQIMTTATAVRGAALRHPGIAPHMAGRPPLGEHGQRIGAGLLMALASAGIPEVTAVQVLQTLVAYLASSLAMAVQAGRRDERWWQARGVVDRLARTDVGHGLFVVGSTEQFEFGLRLLLAGIVTVAGPHQPPEG